jgi:hypothetical protein
MFKGIAILLLSLALLPAAAGCGPAGSLLPGPAPTPDPLGAYRPSLQPAAWPRLEALGPLPRYAIRARLAPAGDRLEGSMRVEVPNPTSSPWPDLVFRLYPNTPHYAAAMTVEQVQVDGRPVPARLEADGAALRLSLPAPLAPGAAATVDMAFAVELPRRDGGYTLFGWEDGILSLPGFYPSLADYGAAGADGGGWAAGVPPLFADVLYGPAALYEVEFSAPAALTLAASGTTLAVDAGRDGSGQKTWRIAGGPMRDVTLLLSDRWESASDQAAGSTVTSYYPAGAEAAGRAALFHAAAALRLYSDLFGDYPYAEFDVVAAPLGYRGMEYSGLVTIGEDLYARYRDQLAFLVAHETAHQWWYAQVGNDTLAHPWLDEGLAEYAAFDYYRRVYSQSAAEELLSGRWQTPYAVAAAHGIDGPVDRPADAMTAANYELLAYAKAALFFNALRDALGEDAYVELLQAYVEAYRWQTVTPQHFFGLAGSLTGADLNPLAEEWLR